MPRPIACIAERVRQSRDLRRRIDRRLREELALEVWQPRFGVFRQALAIRPLPFRDQAHDEAGVVEKLRAEPGAALDDDVFGQKRGEGAACLLDDVPGAAVLPLQHRIAIDCLAQRRSASCLFAKMRVSRRPASCPT